MKNQTASQNVLNTFPTFQEILTNPDYQAHIFYDPSIKAMIKASVGNELASADLVALLVNHMVSQVTGSPFFDTYDMSSSASKSYVFDSSEEAHKVSRDEFQALLKVFWFSYLSIEMTGEQIEAYLDLKENPVMYTIMD
jgi:hypothetical protein